jgi:hypothetical protein
MGIGMNNKEQIDKALLALLGTEKLVSEWWVKPNKAFGDKTPKEAYDRDRDVVKAYMIKQMKW